MHTYYVWKTIRERKKKWIGHKIRNNEWITTLIEGKIDEKPGEVDQEHHL